MTATFTPYGLEPTDEYFLEQLTGYLCTDGLIPQFNLTLAQQWYEKELQEFTARQATNQDNSYTLTTWLYYSAEQNPPRTSQPIKTDNDEAALALAERAVPPGDVVGTLTAPDGRIVARRYVIIHKADVGEGMRMNAGSWKFFAADDEAAKKILQEKTVDWMNILFGTDGVLARN